MAKLRGLFSEKSYLTLIYLIPILTVIVSSTRGKVNSQGRNLKMFFAYETFLICRCTAILSLTLAFIDEIQLSRGIGRCETLY